MPICINDLKAALKKHKLFEDTKERQDFIDALKNAQDKRKFKQAVSRGQTAAKTIDEFKKLIDNRAKLKRYQAHLALRARKSLQEQILRFRTIGDGVKSVYYSIQSNIKGAQSSLRDRVSSNNSIYLGGYANELEKGGALQRFNTYKDQLELLKVFKGETDISKADPETKVIVNATKRVYDSLSNQLRRLGVPVGKIDDFFGYRRYIYEKIISPTGTAIGDLQLRRRLFFELKGDKQAIHDAILKVSEDRFIDEMMNRVDWDRTEPGLSLDKREDFLRRSYKNIVTKIRENKQIGGNFDRPSSTFRSARGRVIHLKDAESEWHVLRTYGVGNVTDTILSTIQQMSKDLSFAQKFGPNPANMSAQILEWAARKGRQEKNIRRVIRLSQLTFDGQMGKLENPSIGMSGKIFEAARAIIYQAKMGAILLKSLPDFAHGISHLRQFGVNSMEAFAIQLKSFIEGMPKKGDRFALGNALGCFTDNYIGQSVATKFGDTGSSVPFVSKSMQLFWKLTGLPRLDNTRRFAMSSTISNLLAKWTKEDFSKLSDPVKRMLNIYSLDETDWRVFQQNRDLFQKQNGRIYLTAHDIDNFRLESFKELTGKESPSTKQLEIAREDLKNRYSDFIVNQNNFGNITHDPLLKWWLPTHWPVLGQVFKIMTMFHTYQFGFVRRILGRFLYGNGARNLYEAFFSSQYRGDLRGMALFAAQSYLFGYLSYAATQLVQGKAVPSFSNGRTWYESLLHSDVLFTLGSFALDEFGSRPEKISELIAGPAFGSVDDAVRLVNTLARGKHPAAALANWSVKNAPGMGFVNLWYTQLAAQQLFLNSMMDSVDPGYTERMRRRARKNHESWFIPPN